MVKKEDFGVMKPFLKWAGNKYPLIKRIKAVLPQGKRLIEPFAGSAAVFLGTDYETALLADSNRDLIGLYQTLQKEREIFIRYCRMLFVPENNRKETYYVLREEFNNSASGRRKAALFLYLNRHGYNGLCRYNASGGYNVPFGRYTKPYFPETEMRAFYSKVQSAQFIVADFREVMRSAEAGDVIYCDPPYIPLSRTANFTSYGASGFGEAEQRTLAELAETLAQRGVPVVISNHDTDFSLQVYGNASLTRFDVQRFISSKGRSRGKAKELLALFQAA
jgi:DNA adenine methylase